MNVSVGSGPRVAYVTPTMYAPPRLVYQQTYSPMMSFCLPVGLNPLQQQRMMQASQIFRTFDRNRNGRMNKKEFRECMKALGVYLSCKKEYKRLFYMVDRDGSGNISEREFCEYWMSTSPY